MTLKIGHIEYANCTPIFSALFRSPGRAGYYYVKGVPSSLNLMLRSGEIDVGPVSSIEYGMSPRSYHLLPGLSISSFGAVKSVLLFSKEPIEDLDGKPIGLTTDSDTSVNLLRIILGRQYAFRNDMRRTSLTLKDALEEFSAVLLIGDAALRGNMANHGLYVYDLGELWHQYTGFPFVFSLWLVTDRAVKEKKSEVAALSARLLEAKELASRSYEEIAATCAEREWMTREALVDYWRTISYDLDEAHLHGVSTFYRFAADLGLIERAPEIRIFSPD